MLTAARRVDPPADPPAGPPADPPAARGPGARAPEVLLVSLLAFGTFAAQLALRDLDDSRLTSWRWLFDGADPVPLLALVAAGIAAAHALALLAPLPRSPLLRGAGLSAAAIAAAACFWRAPETIVDAARYFAQARHLEVHGLGGFLSEWGRAIPAWTDLPLVPALYGLVFRALGEARLHVQILTTLLFAGTVVLTWRTGARVFAEEVGLAAAALLLAMPYLLTQVATILVDVPTMFFLALAVHASVRAVDRGGAGPILLAAAALAAAALTKYSAWLLLPGALAVAAVHGRGTPGAPRVVGAIALAAALLAGAALLLHPEVHARQLALLASYQAPGLRRWGESFLAIFAFQLHPLVAAGALVSAAAALRRRDARWLAVAWPVLVLLALQIHRVRYWVPALPSLALLAALGLQVVRSARLRALAVGAAVASSLGVALRGELPFLERTSAVNLRDAGAFLDGLREPAVEVFTPPRRGAPVNPAVSVPLLDLYTAKRLVHAHAPPPGEEVRAARDSPLRFTWELPDPGYGAPAGADAPAAVAVITDDLAAPLPPALERRVAGLRLVRTFAADEGVFEHRTLVRVYRPAASPDE